MKKIQIIFMVLLQFYVASYPVYAGLRRIFRSKPSTLECPIRIIPNKTVPFTKNCGLPTFIPKPIKLGKVRISNDHHTIKIVLKDKSKIVLESNFFKYKFSQIHFHWGKNDSEGGETYINKKRFPLEMHVVFYKNTFSSFEEALKGTLRTDLVVMSVLFEIGHGDQRMFAFTDRMGELTMPTSFFDFQFDQLDILPRNLNEFYEFDGSLTTPPYSEITTWIVFPETMYISSKQLKQFRTIHNDKNARILSNSRALQRLGNRIVYHVVS